MKETFSELGTSLDRNAMAVERVRGNWSVKTNWMKHVNHCRKAGPQEPWKREYCRMRQKVMPECGVFVDAKENYCNNELGKGLSKAARNYILAANNECKEFFASK